MNLAKQVLALHESTNLGVIDNPPVNGNEAEMFEAPKKMTAKKAGDIVDGLYSKNGSGWQVSIFDLSKISEPAEKILMDGGSVEDAEKAVIAGLKQYGKNTNEGYGDEQIGQGGAQYKMRAETEEDVKRFKRAARDYVSNFSGKRIGKLDPATVEATFHSHLSLKAIKELLSQVPDGHVMAETVALAKDYTGERVQESFTLSEDYFDDLFSGMSPEELEKKYPSPKPVKFPELKFYALISDTLIVFKDAELSQEAAEKLTEFGTERFKKEGVLSIENSNQAGLFREVSRWLKSSTNKWAEFHTKDAKDLGRSADEIIYLASKNPSDESLSSQVMKAHKMDEAAKEDDKQLTGTNLYLKSFGRDSNGNSVVRVSSPNGKGYAIQTNGNLPHAHKLITSGTTLKDISDADLKSVSSEVSSYIKKHGSEKQKGEMKTYESFEDQLASLKKELEALHVRMDKARKADDHHTVEELKDKAADIIEKRHKLKEKMRAEKKSESFSKSLSRQIMEAHDPENELEDDSMPDEVIDPDHADEGLYQHPKSNWEPQNAIWFQREGNLRAFVSDITGDTDGQFKIEIFTKDGKELKTDTAKSLADARKAVFAYFEENQSESVINGCTYDFNDDEKNESDDLVKKYAIRFESQLYGATEEEFNKFVLSLKLDKLPKEKADSEKEALTKAWQSLKESKSVSEGLTSAQRKVFVDDAVQVMNKVKKVHPQMDAKALMNATRSVMLSMCSGGSDVNTPKLKQYFPDSYNEEIYTNGDKNMYDSLFMSQYDTARDTILRQAAKQVGVSESFINESLLSDILTPQAKKHIADSVEAAKAEGNDIVYVEIAGLIAKYIDNATPAQYKLFDERNGYENAEKEIKKYIKDNYKMEAEEADRSMGESLIVESDVHYKAGAGKANIGAKVNFAYNKEYGGGSFPSGTGVIENMRRIQGYDEYLIYTVTPSGYRSGRWYGEHNLKAAANEALHDDVNANNIKRHEEHVKKWEIELHNAQNPKNKKTGGHWGDKPHKSKETVDSAKKGLEQAKERLQHAKDKANGKSESVTEAKQVWSVDLRFPKGKNSNGKRIHTIQVVGDTKEEAEKNAIAQYDKIHKDVWPNSTTGSGVEAYGTRKEKMKNSESLSSQVMKAHTIDESSSQTLKQYFDEYKSRIAKVSKEVEAIASEIYEEDTSLGDVVTISKQLAEMVIGQIERNEVP